MHVTNQIPAKVQRIALMYTAARAIVDRKIDMSDKSAVWDVIYEFWHDCKDWKANAEFYNRVLTVAKALAS